MKNENDTWEYIYKIWRLFYQEKCDPQINFTKIETKLSELDGYTDCLTKKELEVLRSKDKLEDYL